MDRTVLLDHLALAERHVAEGQARIERQRRILEELARDGHKTSLARQLLAQFEDILALHIRDRDRLRSELADAERSDTPSVVPVPGRRG